MIVVLTFNVVKLLAMIYIWCHFDAEQLLTIPGDALQSFIRQEDNTTRGMCLADQRTAASLWKSSPHATTAYASHPKNWYPTISVWRWCVIGLTISLAILLNISFLVWAVLIVKSRGTDIGSFGMLGMSPSRLIFSTFKANAAMMSMIANLPQLLMAPLYLLVNDWYIVHSFAWDYCELGCRGIPTDFDARDYAHDYSVSAKFLMMSKPRGSQRGPQLAGMPILAAACSSGIGMLLHWIVSQIIFPVQIDVYSPSGSLDLHSQIVNCGFSIGAMVAFFIAIFFTVMMISFLGKEDVLWKKRRWVALPPLISTNSAALSAACHLPDGRHNASTPYEELRWGATQEPHGDRPGHCAIVTQEMWSTGKAWPPQPESRYE